MDEGTPEQGENQKRKHATVLYSRTDGCYDNEESNAGADDLLKKPRTVDEKNEFNLYVPDWPFKNWGEVAEGTKEGIQLSEDVSPCFSIFIGKLSQNINTFEDDVSKSLFSSVQNSINEAAELLCQSHPLFKNCHIRLAGSVSEGTKVGQANEFDYLLLIDLFGDRKKFRLYIRENYMMIEVLDEDVAQYYNNEGMLIEIDDHFYLHRVREILMTLFVAEFEKHLPDGWDIQRKDGKFCMSHIATTLHLTCTKYNLDIDIDICLCCPVLPVDIENTIEIQDSKLRDIERKLFRYLRKRQEDVPNSLYAIIGKDEVAFPGNMYTRIASPSLELDMLSRYGKLDGRVKVYCVVKCLALSFLPKVTKIFGCKRCCHNLVPSYVLKNILFFMINHYLSDEYWSDSEIGHRVLEVFNLLRICVTLTTETNKDLRKSVSTFCTPGNIWLDDISTFNPYIPEEHRTKRSGDCLFTEDSHKPLYEISSSPVYKEGLETNNTEFNTELECWFLQLNQDHWNSYALMEKMFLLLQQLSKI